MPCHTMSKIGWGWNGMGWNGMIGKGKIQADKSVTEQTNERIAYLFLNPNLGRVI